MKFDTNLSRQDKRTIAIVVYFAVVALFAWYFIRPAWVKLGTLDDQIDTARSEQAINRSKIINLSSAESLYDKAVSDITDSTADFYDVMDNSEIEKLVTEYVLSYGLTPVNFVIDIRDGSYCAEQPYIYADMEAVSNSDPNAGQDVADATETSGDETQSLLVAYYNALSNTDQTTMSQVQCAKISILITGNGATEQQLIDDLTKNPSVRITGFTWSAATPAAIENEDGTVTVINQNDRQLSIDLNFYMSEKPEFDSTEEG